MIAHRAAGSGRRARRLPAAFLGAVLALLAVAGAGAQPGPGEVVIAWPVTIAPNWFDPTTGPAQITPFGLLCAVRDGLVRPLPGPKMGNSLAESWTESTDGLRHEFKLRRGLKFHNGDPVTTEDVTFSFDGEDAENVRRDPRLTLVPSKHASIFWIELADQWDPKSPWGDRRMRLAVNHALNRQVINELACPGVCPPAGIIVPRVMDFALQAQPMAHDPARARPLLADAGYPKGIDAGEFVPIPPFTTVAQ
jgi:ABC-type transport system substrate-binding protein